MNTPYDPRQDDPMHDDYNMTQEEFEETASAMNFPSITIQDPAAVGAWLDQHLPARSPHLVSYLRGKFFTIHWMDGGGSIDVFGVTPEELIENIRAELAKNEPLERIRKEAEAHGYALMKLPED